MDRSRLSSNRIQSARECQHAALIPTGFLGYDLDIIHVKRLALNNSIVPKIWFSTAVTKHLLGLAYVSASQRAISNGIQSGFLVVGRFRESDFQIH